TRLTTNATGLVPGDMVERAVDLDGPSSGTTGIGSIALGVSVGASTLLDSDTTNGLRMNVDSCPSAWTESGTAPAYTYSCSGSVTSLVSNQPVIGNFNLPSLNSMNVSGVDHLRVKLTLPGTAPTTMMGLSDTLGYVFTPTARARPSHQATYAPARSSRTRSRSRTATSRPTASSESFAEETTRS